MRDLIGSTDRLAQIALLSRMTCDAVHRVQDDVPGLRVIRYEDLSREPVEQFRLLYQTFGLSWTPTIAERVAAATSGTGRTDRSHAWTLRYGLSPHRIPPDGQPGGVAVVGGEADPGGNLPGAGAYF